jgi:hypothetical protein
MGRGTPGRVDTQDKILILGDFNFQAGERNAFTDCLRTRGFQQVKTESTHAEGRTINHCYVYNVPAARHFLHPVFRPFCSLYSAQLMPVIVHCQRWEFLMRPSLYMLFSPGGEQAPNNKLGLYLFAYSFSECVRH